jgi:hypothetical protein
MKNEEETWARRVARRKALRQSHAESVAAIPQRSLALLN